MFESTCTYSQTVHVHFEQLTGLRITKETTLLLNEHYLFVISFTVVNNSAKKTLVSNLDGTTPRVSSCICWNNVVQHFKQLAHESSRKPCCLTSPTSASSLLLLLTTVLKAHTWIAPAGQYLHMWQFYLFGNSSSLLMDIGRSQCCSTTLTCASSEGIPLDTLRYMCTTIQLCRAAVNGCKLSWDYDIYRL